MVFPTANSSLNNEIPAHDDLYAGKIRSVPLTVAAGTYARGAVLEIDAATDILSALATPANAYAVMPHDVTLDTDTVLAVWTEGDFNQDAVDLNGAALAPTKTALAGRGIHLREWGVAPDAS